MNVFLVDDHPALRRGLRTWLATVNWIVTAEAGNLAEARKVIERCRGLAHEAFNMIVLDVQLQNENGLDLIPEIRAAGIKAPVLVYSQLDEAVVVPKALASGAQGFVNKNADEMELLTAFNHLAKGERYINPVFGANMLSGTLSQGRPWIRHDALSNREREAMLLIAKGNTTAEMAQIMGVSPNTICSFRNRILKKLELDSSAEVRQYALQHLLV